MAERKEWVTNKKRNFENQLSQIIKSVVKPSVKNNSKVSSELMTNWYKILGENYFSKIDYKKLMPLDKKSNKFRLYISVRKSTSLEISHSKDLIIQKINTFLGYDAIKEIIISNDKKSRDSKNNTIKYFENTNNGNTLKELPKLDIEIVDEGLEDILRKLKRNIGENNV